MQGSALRSPTIKQTIAVHCGKSQGIGVHRDRDEGVPEAHLSELFSKAIAAGSSTFLGRAWPGVKVISELTTSLNDFLPHSFTEHLLLNFTRTAWKIHRNNKRKGRGRRRRNQQLGIFSSLRFKFSVHVSPCNNRPQKVEGMAVKFSPILVPSSCFSTFAPAFHLCDPVAQTHASTWC